MKFRMTKSQLIQAYQLLSETEPFKAWNLPDATEIKFVVIRSRRMMGYYLNHRRSEIEHEIGISERCVGSLMTLLRVMAHEKVHLYQHITKPRTHTPGVEHNAAFRKLSDEVCEIHGWDRMEFADADIAG